MHEDYKYIKALLDNNTSQINEIYDKFEARIIRMVRNNSGNLQDGKDLFQESLIVIYLMGSREDFQLTSSFYSLLFGVAHRKWLKVLKKRTGKEVTISTEIEFTDEQDIELAIFSAERRSLYRESFAKLGERCRKILSLFTSGKKMKEIALAMAFASDNVAKKEKFKCQKKLITMIRQDARYNELL